MRGLASCLCALGLSGLSLSSPVFAADDDPPAEEAASEEAEAPAGEASSEVADEPEPSGEVSATGNSKELLLGARYRGIIIPQFVWGLFADGGSSMYVNGFGPEVAIRTEKVEYN